MSLREQFDEPRHHRLGLVVVREEEGLQRGVHAESDRLHDGAHSFLQAIVLDVERLQRTFGVLLQTLRQQRPHRRADAVVVHDEMTQLRTEAGAETVHQLRGDRRPHVVIGDVQRLQLREHALRDRSDELLRRLLSDALGYVEALGLAYR